MTSALETIRYHSGIAGEEVADMVDSLEREVSSLREQVEKLTEESVVLRASSRSKLETISSLELQVEKLTKERGAWREDLAIVTREALKTIESHKEQLAALAEQNEKLRKVLLRLACLGNGDQYGNSIGNCIAQEALSLPNLATPMLNKYRAEAMREAAEKAKSDDLMLWDKYYRVLMKMADELEGKTDEH